MARVISGVVFVVSLLLLCPASVVCGATYYVDFEGGSDSADGRSTRAAFRHCPGDPDATPAAAGTMLAPGDTVIFKGGVTYRGSIVCGWSGAEDRPITYDGNTNGTFGEGRAIVDGSEPLTGWRRCESADECGGNPNWASIHYCDAPSGSSLLNANLYQGDRLLWIAQDPDPSDPFYQDRAGDYLHIPEGAATPTTITDAGYLTHSDPHHWDGAYVAIWAQPNYNYFQAVTGYEPSEHRISYERLSAPHYEKRGRYAMMNSRHVLDTPGEYAFIRQRGKNGPARVYLWPPTDGTPPTGVTISRRSTAFDINGHSHLAFQGLLIQKFISRPPNRGAGISNDRGNPESIVVRDNVIRYCNKDSTWKHAGINLTGVRGGLVEGNRIYENRRCGGIYLLGGSTSITVKDNVIRKDGYVGIWLMGSPRCQVIGNTVEDNRGTHANAITVYHGSNDVLVSGNRVFNSQVAFASEKVSDVTVAYNVFHSDGGYVVCNWYESTNLKFYNNVILGKQNKALMLSRRDTTNCVVKNNILSGLLINQPCDVSHNLYVGDYRGLDRRRRSLKEDEIIETDLSAIFVDPVRHDYRLKPGSPAMDAGADVGLGRDCLGTSVPQGKAPDIGAYEYVEDMP